MNEAKNDKHILLSVEKVSKSLDFRKTLVLEDINFDLFDKDILAILGRSGIGKSTLMRIIAGLSHPTTGRIIYKNQRHRSSTPTIAMVFQNFALMPWLNVRDNVLLSLEMHNLPLSERKRRAFEAIEAIGLDGFEEAYPRELSAGMCQRVSIARALVVKADLLLMDEPFSALDVLTAENLRDDLLRIWNSEQYAKAMIFITHNIEEAVLTANRIMILSNKGNNIDDPATITHMLDIDIPEPKHSKDSQVLKLIDQIYSLMLTYQKRPFTRGMDILKEITYQLPDVEVAELVGLLIEMNDLQISGSIDLPLLANHVNLEVNSLFPIIEMLSILHFAQVSNGDILMTNDGKIFLEADIELRKKILADALYNYIPFTKFLIEQIENSKDQFVYKENLLQKISSHMKYSKAKDFLELFMRWGRFCELFGYELSSDKIYLLDRLN